MIAGQLAAASGAVGAEVGAEAAVGVEGVAAEVEHATQIRGRQRSDVEENTEGRRRMMVQR